MDFASILSAPCLAMANWWFKNSELLGIVAVFFLMWAICKKYEETQHRFLKVIGVAVAIWFARITFKVTYDYLYEGFRFTPLFQEISPVVNLIYAFIMVTFQIAAFAVFFYAIWKYQIQSEKNLPSSTPLEQKDNLQQNP